MPDENHKYDGLYQLTTHADRLNAINTPDPDAAASYEIMSGSLIWSDELNADLPIEVIWALRELFAYRTYLMLNDAEVDNAFWNQCIALFPNWIGFLPERRKPTRELLAEYRRGVVSIEACLRKFGRGDDEGQ